MLKHYLEDQVRVTGSARLDYYRFSGDSLQGRYHLLRLHPLSVNALREDLRVSHRAVSNWLDIFERLYAIVRLNPFGAPKIRAVKKERKHYQYDWTLVADLPKRFENLVAMHLRRTEDPD